MSKFLVGVALAALASVASNAQARAPDLPQAPMAAYSSRMAWEAAVRAGDTQARWLLAWAYAEQGDWPKAWSWIEREATGPDVDRAYLKGWLAWRSGQAGQVDEIVAAASCSQSRCLRLRLNAYWDMGEWSRAQSVAGQWFGTDQTGETTQLALLASLLAGNLAEFDRIAGAVDWKSSPKFSDWRSPILELVKIRANL